MKAYVLIETAAGKTKQVKKTLAKVKSPRSSVSAMDAVTGPYDFIAVVEGQTLEAISSLVTDAIGIIDGVTRTTTCVAVTVGRQDPSPLWGEGWVRGALAVRERHALSQGAVNRAA